jgi:integrase
MVETSDQVFSDTRIMAKKKHIKDKKLHNFDEKLHNSNELDLTWQEEVDLEPEDEVEGGSEIYYFTDENGNIHSREFLAEELIPDETEAEDTIKRKSSGELQKLKPGAVDVVNLVRPDEAPQHVTLPAPRSGDLPLDIRISSEVVPDLLTKGGTQRRSDVFAADEQVVIHLHNGSVTNEPVRVAHDRDVRAPLTLCYTRAELDSYIAYRSEGMAEKSKDWIIRSSDALWESTKGEISHQTVTGLRTFVLEKYQSRDSHSKVLSFATGFLNFLAQTKIDPSYLSFRLFLEMPKTIKVKKALTERIVTREDIETVFQRIAAKEEKGTDPSKIRNYRAFTLLASYTGLRPSTIQRLTVGQFRTALNEEKHVLHVFAEQEKNRVEHYVPLHPLVVSAISKVLAHDFGENDDDKPFFLFNSFEKWLERQRIPLPRVRDPTKAHLWLSDFRKFAEQFGDIIGWDTTNRKYVLAHGMTGVDWEHYKHPLPEDVYDTYMRYWRDIDLAD